MQWLLQGINRKKQLILPHETIDSIQKRKTMKQDASVSRTQFTDQWWQHQKMNSLKADLAKRILLAWSTFGSLMDMFYPNITNTLKARTFGHYGLPILTCGTEIWAINKEIINTMQIAQRSMEWSMIGITFGDKVIVKILEKCVKERLCKPK